MLWILNTGESGRLVQTWQSKQMNGTKQPHTDKKQVIKVMKKCSLAEHVINTKHTIQFNKIKVITEIPKY